MVGVDSANANTLFISEIDFFLVDVSVISFFEGKN